MINRKTLRATALNICAIVALFSSAIPQGRAHHPLHPHDFIAADSQDSSAQERMATPSCPGNLIQNGDFTAGVNVVGDGSMPSSSVANWTSASGSPQVTNAMGCGNTGFISMWGNKVVGEAVQQSSVPIVCGKAYTFSACVRWVSKPGLPTYVYFRVSASDGPVTYGGGTPIGLTPGIISPDWTLVTLPVWVANGNYNTITINPQNNSSVNDGAEVSWGQIDNICIQEAASVLICKRPAIPAHNEGIDRCHGNWLLGDNTNKWTYQAAQGPDHFIRNNGKPGDRSCMKCPNGGTIQQDFHGLEDWCVNYVPAQTAATAAGSCPPGFTLERQ